MSGFLNSLHEHHQQRKEERREALRERHDRFGRHHDDGDYESQHHGRRHHGDEDEDPYGPQSYQPQPQPQPQFPGQGLHGYGPPAGPPPSARGPSPGGFGRGDFASDADIERMIASGEFTERQGYDGRGYGGAGGERGNTYDRYDTPTGPPPGQGYGERASDYGRYDAPPGPPIGRDHQSWPHQEGHGTSAYTSGYSGGPDRHNQYGSQQTQGRSQYETPQGPPPGYGRGQGNPPACELSAAARDGEERFGSGYGGPRNDYSEPARQGEAASYYNQQSASGQGDRYAHLAGLAQEHGDDDPELYRQATQGLQEKIQSQAQSRRPGRDGKEDYEVQIDAHRKAYGEDDHGPMDADTIGAAAAMEAFKQTAAAARPSNAPAGAFQTGSPSKAGGSAREEEEVEADTASARAGASGGLQDKLMALAMSHAGKLFDKKNAGKNGGGGDKAQAMQSAAASAMQLFTQYQSKGKLESGDMQQVIGLAMKLL